MTLFDQPSNRVPRPDLFDLAIAAGEHLKPLEFGDDVVVIDDLVSTAQTRHEANEAIQPHKRTLKDQVYAYIAINGPVTDQQIAIGLNMPENTARPRRLELAKDGKIKIAGSQLTRKGRRAVAWMVTTSDDRDF